MAKTYFSRFFDHFSTMFNTIRNHSVRICLVLFILLENLHPINVTPAINNQSSRFTVHMHLFNFTSASIWNSIQLMETRNLSIKRSSSERIHRLLRSLSATIYHMPVCVSHHLFMCFFSLLPLLLLLLLFRPPARCLPNLLPPPSITTPFHPTVHYNVWFDSWENNF